MPLYVCIDEMTTTNAYNYGLQYFVRLHTGAWLASPLIRRGDFMHMSQRCVDLLVFGGFSIRNTGFEFSYVPAGLCYTLQCYSIMQTRVVGVCFFVSYFGSAGGHMLSNPTAVHARLTDAMPLDLR
eukprot:9470728-Pyramimonas_sp.AAC.1